MRRKEPFIKAEVTASFDLYITQFIPREQLLIMEAIHANILDHIRSALAQIEQREREQEELHRELARRHAAYIKRLLRLRRIERHGASMAAMQRFIDGSATDVRLSLAKARRIARERLADAKRAAILRLYDQGHGPRPIAREIARRFGSCSPSYAAKVINTYRASLPLLRVVK